MYIIVGRGHKCLCRHHIHILLLHTNTRRILIDGEKNTRALDCWILDFVLSALHTPLIDGRSLPRWAAHWHRKLFERVRPAYLRNAKPWRVGRVYLDGRGGVSRWGRGCGPARGRPARCGPARSGVAGSGAAAGWRERRWPLGGRVSRCWGACRDRCRELGRQWRVPVRVVPMRVVPMRVVPVRVVSVRVVPVRAVPVFSLQRVVKHVPFSRTRLGGAAAKHCLGVHGLQVIGRHVCGHGRISTSDPCGEYQHDGMNGQHRFRTRGYCPCEVVARLQPQAAIPPENELCACLVPQV